MQYIILPILPFAVQGKRGPADATNIHKGCDGDNPRGRCILDWGKCYCGCARVTTWQRSGAEVGSSWRAAVSIGNLQRNLGCGAPGTTPYSSTISRSRIATCLRSSRARPGEGRAIVTALAPLQARVAAAATSHGPTSGS